MNIIEIIEKKKNRNSLTKEELSYAVDGYIKGIVKDYQMSSLLMAICINGMTEEETLDLTDIMLKSGEQIDLSFLPGIKVDKHSTGGIGDKTTIVLAPLVASCGIPVVKMSGRGLGYTGGTIDKLESIKGFQTSLTAQQFKKQIDEIGVAIASQTGNLVPADKKLYALRDVSGTTESIPLIASSIMSKKLASGADKLVIDVKVGKGALMKNEEDAKKLAHLMVSIGKKYNRETICILSNMHQPLGCAIGNGLEIEEAIHTLHGKGPKDLEELVLTLGSYMLCLTSSISKEEAIKKLKENIKNGKAYDKFLSLISFQKGNIDYITKSSQVKELFSEKEGYIENIDAEVIGKYVHSLGAGRMKEDDVIDYGVGVILNKKVGDYIKKGESLATIYYTKETNIIDLQKAFTLSDVEVSTPNLVYGVISS